MRQPARLPGWERRLADHLADARTWPYRLGETDCLRLALGAERALTGHDRWPDFAGTYSTKRTALIAIARFGGSTVEAAIARLFDTPLRPPLSARRGDVMHLRDDAALGGAGLAHLGVCTGPRVALFTEKGLWTVPLDHPFVLHTVPVG